MHSTPSIPVLMAVCAAAGFAAAQGEAPRFNRDIRPILSEHCFQCHGPDGGHRKGGFRLDQRASAVEKGAIVPGDLAASALLARVRSTDPDEQMPPPAAKKPLDAKQIETLAAWISAGAEYEPHWAFVPLPAAAPLDAAGNLIDGHVRARLAEEGIAPAPEAERETLLRRVTFDLTGLPPTLEEIDAFLADTAPEAYERAVERLLASPAYGERMALDWLDTARYADSFGYQADRASSVWPWRDWVIRAFNGNLPYDDFIRWQLAGDLLPGATQDQRLATAFSRLHRQTNEGGSVLEEFRQEYVADRVRTFGTAFLGLTLECARCHDHKFDPITQRDYYAFGAFFDDIDESGMYSHYTDAVPTPMLLLYKEGEVARHALRRKAVTEAEVELDAARAAAGAGYRAWLAKPDRAMLPPAMHLPLDTLDGGKTPDIAGNRSGSIGTGAEIVPGARGNALRFDGDNALETPGTGAYHRYDAFSAAVWIMPAETVPHQVVLHYSKAREDAASRGWELLLQDGRPTVTLAHFWPGNAIQVKARQPIPEDAWSHVAFAYDGSSRAAGIMLFVDGAPVETETVRDGLEKDIAYESDAPAGIALAARSRDIGFKGGALDEVMLFDRAITALEAAHLAGRADFAAAPDSPALLAYYAAHVDEGVAGATRKLHRARRAESSFVQGVQAIMTMRDMPQPRQAFVLARGAYDQPAEPVEPGTPASLPPFPAAAPRNRLGLAQWLLDPQHPLAARVAVNRYWLLFFGRGIVESQEDFGSQGTPPTHPELLDALARRFIATGWDLKALHRLIVTSATYRQSSRYRPELAERDPFNLLMARGPANRLSAEQLRDQALAASGLLTPAIGGPSVKPYQPGGLWEDAGWETYTQDHGEALYRRSMYTYWKRTVPHPAMLAFDAGSREVCAARRETTQTPLQSLVLLNDPQFVEAARAMAARLMQQFPGVPERLDAACRLLTGRRPDEASRTILARAYDEQRSLFSVRPETAAAYAAAGEAPNPEGLDPVDQAALAAVIQALMNLDDAQMKT